MQLSSENIIKSGLITGRNGTTLNKDWLLNNSGPSSIDLTIREIIYEDDDGKPVNVDSHLLKPQETVCLISEQEFAMNDRTVAYVFLKNSLSQAGLLAFNTGIIDANYKGPISTLVTNYSKYNVLLKSPEAPSPPNSKQPDENFCSFFRVVFHRMQVANPTVSSPNSYNDYVIRRKNDFYRIPKEFLDPGKLRQKIEEGFKEQIESVSKAQKNWLAIVITVLAALFTLTPFMAEYLLERTTFVPESVKNNQVEFGKKITALEVKFDHINEKFDKYELQPQIQGTGASNETSHVEIGKKLDQISSALESMKNMRFEKEQENLSRLLKELTEIKALSMGLITTLEKMDVERSQALVNQVNKNQQAVDGLIEKLDQVLIQQK